MTATADVGLAAPGVTDADRAAWQEWAQARAQEAFGLGREAAERGAPLEARRWLERARRLSGGAVPVDVALALARLDAGDPAGAATLLRELLRRFDFREGWTALAAACRAMGDTEQAAVSLSRSLGRFAPDPAVTAMMGSVARDAMWPGWCGLSGFGVLRVDGHDFFGSGARAAQSSGRIEVRLDGEVLGGVLPRGWRRAVRLEVRRGSAPLLGSPIDVQSVLRAEGFAEWRDGAIEGWLWHPGEPERAPELRIVAASACVRTLQLDEFAERIDSETPLARPRRLLLPADTLPKGPIRLFAVSGKAEGVELTGSPIDPARLQSRRGRMRPVPASHRGGPPASLPPNPAFDVVIPVYRHLRRTLDCIDSVRQATPEVGSGRARILVVEDASPEPALPRALDRLAADGAITLLRNERNLGFPRSANRGIEAAAGRDVILLNSDTLVATGWSEALRRAAYAAPDIGSATPLSNDASILSYPSLVKPNPVPDRAETGRTMALAARANAGQPPIEIPTGNGFCMYLRRDCLAQTGLFREDLFAQGYGEENDFCLRARHLGWRHVAASDAYVGHIGNVSFGASRQALMRRNLEILARLYPGYDALIQAHIARDPLHESRRRIDRLAFRAASGPKNPGVGKPGVGQPGVGKPAVLLITHAQSGGVERVVQARAAALDAQGLRPVLLRPEPGGCRVEAPGSDHHGDGVTNLRYRIDSEMDALVELLAGASISHAEWHHWLGHAPMLRGLCARLAIPYDLYVHDYASFCARVALVGAEARYCGEPDVRGCESCIARAGSLLGEPIGPAALRARSASELAQARRVLAPSLDTARRIARHFPGCRPEVSPWQDDAPELPLERLADGSPAPATLIPSDPRRLRVCVIGAIGVEKGFDVLLACLRDSRARALELDFVLVGHSADDDALLAAGCLDITGPYREEDAVPLIRAQNCDLAFLPSIWPETWCFTLGLGWRAGLPAAVFDLGAQAERVRRTGRGAVLPLGLGAAALNDALCNLCRARRPEAPRATQEGAVPLRSAR